MSAIARIGSTATPVTIADSIARLSASLRVNGERLAAPTETVSLDGAPAASPVYATTAVRAATVVSYVNNVKPTADKNVNAVIAGGNHWFNTGAGADGETPSASADHTLTYSFRASASGLGAMDANGFQALTGAQQDVVRSAFDYLETIADVTFTEVESGAGQLNVGANVQASSAGYAYYANDGATGGNVYLAANTASFADAASWQKGGYEWETIIHEIGHALGLKHTGNYNAGGGGTPGPYLSKTLDNRTHSIMSYNNDAKAAHLVTNNGAGGLSSSYVNADSYQLLDIAALQYLYGTADTDSATTYAFSDGAVFSRTIYDTHAGSRIDLSGMTQASVVDLRGGHRSSIGLRDAYAASGLTQSQYAAATSGGVKLSKLLGTPSYTGASNLGIAAGSRIRTAVGGAGADTFISGSEIGGAADLDGGGGSDQYFIASGDASVHDTGGAADAVYVVKKSGATWSVSADGSTLTQKDNKTLATLATVSLAGIETVGYWGGKAAKAAGKPLYVAPAAQPVASRIDTAA